MWFCQCFSNLEKLPDDFTADFDSCKDNCMAFAISSSSCWLETTLGSFGTAATLFFVASSEEEEKSMPSFFNALYKLGIRLS